MDYLVRDQGCEIGSFSLEQIEAKLDDHQIGMMAEVYDGKQWITVADMLENVEEERRREAEQLLLQQKAAAKRQEEEQRNREMELEIEKQRTRQMEVELEREAPIRQHFTGSLHKLSGAGIAGYICVGFSFLMACVFWASLIFGFPLVIGIALWTGVATGSGGFILGLTNCFLGKASRTRGIFQILGSVISLLLLVVPFIFMEVLIARFS